MSRPTIAIATMQRAPLDVVVSWIAYHRALAPDRIYFFADDPNDPVIEHFKGDELVRVLPCDPPHYRPANWAAVSRRCNITLIPPRPGDPLETRQHFNFTLAIGLAATEGIDWVLCIDGDELAYIDGRPLSAMVEHAPSDADALIVHNLEAIPERAADRFAFSDFRWFRDAPIPQIGRTTAPRGLGPFRILNRLLGIGVRKLLPVAIRALGCRATLFGGKFYRGYEQGKALVRVSPRIGFVAAHKIEAPAGASAYSRTARNGRILHFDAGSYGEWVRKWRMRVADRSNVDRLTEVRRLQAELLLRLIESGDEAELQRHYLQLYGMSARDRRVLGRLGLVREIALDPALFVA